MSVYTASKTFKFRSFGPPSSRTSSHDVCHVSYIAFSLNISPSCRWCLKTSDGRWVLKWSVPWLSQNGLAGCHPLDECCCCHAAIPVRRTPSNESRMMTEEEEEERGGRGCQSRLNFPYVGMVHFETSKFPLRRFSPELCFGFSHSWKYNLRSNISQLNGICCFEGWNFQVCERIPRNNCILFLVSWTGTIIKVFD